MRKKCLWLFSSVFLLTSSSILLCQDRYEPVGGTEIVWEKKEQAKWPLLAIGVNPAGFLQFGPSAHIDVRLFNRTCFSAFFINHSMGMLSEAMIFGDNPRLYGSNCMGYGIGVKQYFKKPERKSAWYAALFAGSSYNEATYNEGPPSEFTEKVNSLVLTANFGKQWSIGRFIYLSTGLFAGTAYGNEDKVYARYVYQYETMQFAEQERLIEDYSGEFYPYVFLEVTCGIHF